jgi:hypothetical protein
VIAENAHRRYVKSGQDAIDTVELRTTVAGEHGEISLVRHVDSPRAQADAPARTLPAASVDGFAVAAVSPGASDRGRVRRRPTDYGSLVVAVDH